MTAKPIELKLLDVTPDRLDVVDVLTWLKAYRDVLLAVCPIETSSVPAVALVGIKKGSSRFQIHVAHRLRPAVPIVGRAVLSGDFSPLSATARRALKSLVSGLKTAGHRLELPAVRGRKPLLVGTTVVDTSESESYSSRTTLYGRINLVGGGRSSAEEGGAKLLLGDGTVVRLTGDRTLIKKIATNLYEEVGVEGTASWDATTNIPFEMQVESHIERPSGDAAKAFSRLAHAAGDHCDKVDVADYVASLRSVDR